MRTLRGLRALALSLLPAVTLLSGPEAAGAERPGPAVRRLPLTDGAFGLTATDHRPLADELARTRLTRRVSLADVLDTELTTDSRGRPDGWLGLRRMRACAGAEALALPPVSRRAAWCWDSSHRDDTTMEWLPQGLSSTGTADGGDGAIQRRSALAIAWHHENPGRPAAGCRSHNLLRLTLIDHATRRYRHVLLVEPTAAGPSSTGAGGPGFRYVTGHGGGVVWYGNHLYVTDTVRGLRVFDLGRMAKVDTYGSGVTTYGVGADGRSSACGYPYVVPQTHTYRQDAAVPAGGCGTRGAGGRPAPRALCFSWLSLDKSGSRTATAAGGTGGTGGTGGSGGTGGAGAYRLVVGEWYGSVRGARVVRYRLNPMNAPSAPGLLPLTGGRAVPDDAYTADRYTGLQGGMTWTDTRGVLNFAFHKGCETLPNIFARTWLGDTRPTLTTACQTRDGSPDGIHPRGNWAAGTVQALSHWPRRDGRAVDELWGLTEKVCPPGRRTARGGPLPLRDPLDACSAQYGDRPLSLRTVFAVGFHDPLVQGRH
ncbi:hypothetical protein [Streptomyces clavuligerus]|uniref:hypothetical protein n=1 Tax=Streptomyces clavuligerus TaxID=1901 RepID=UPI00020D9654|nr:hypothetical protein [Streptomyces clavuligerus]AXU13303.1 hypothetical protein D1794_11470 [Streptomyces clavuligerus]MBY6303255.1 hypothetical protein [Streptomyces clavuligerus]QCS06087.1 hypothetical protein CRV15_10900 [Streptomyces clavuligerus]QPJ94553.1 hypothetical protein GE265_17040 [Streptomyces clavuligerus]QPL63370.1 hypothetical protein I3J04_11210 [Streptomyces clavuligerus]